MKLKKRALSVVGAVLLALGITGPAAASAISSVQPPAPAAAQIEPRLLEQLQSVSADTDVEVIVGATSTAAVTKAITAAGLEPRIVFKSIGYAATVGPAAKVKAIAAQPGVTYLQGNWAVRTSTNTAPTATRVPEAEATFTAPAPHTTLDGTGVGVAMVDSGAAGDHPMFHDSTGKTRLLNIKSLCLNLLECGVHAGAESEEYFVDMTGYDTDVIAAGGHGTHVMSIAGGREVTTADGVNVRGIARNASLYALGTGAGLNILNAAASLNWILEHHADPCGVFTPAPDVAGGCAPIKVVNNSWSGNPGDYNPADIHAVIGERLVLEGVTVVWAASNDGGNGTTNMANPPGQSPKGGVIMVANYDDAGTGTRDGSLNPDSSRGQSGRPESFPDVSAPGTDILAACRPWLVICNSLNVGDLNYGSISGTSMAAPHVAGMVALLLQKDPTLTPAAIEDLLEDSAYKFTAGAGYVADTASASAPLPAQQRNDNDTTSYDKGHGLVDLAAALYSLTGGIDPGPSTPNPCSGITNSYTDPADDATELLLVDTTLGQLSYPGLDVVQVSAASIAGGNAKFTIKVKDLTADPAPGATGDQFRYSFSFAGKTYELQLVRRISGVGTTANTFRLIQNNLTAPVTIAAALTGAFDTVTDEIWAEVPATAIQTVYPGDPLLTTGSVISGVSVLGQRWEGPPGGPAVTPTVDTAATPCSLTLP